MRSCRDTMVVCWLLLPTLTGAAPAPDFETQVMPVLTKAGCNSAECHGAAIGRGGFRLSLLGYDPQADYSALVEEFKGRRVNLVRPEKSLILRKPRGVLEHGGGVRLSRRKPGYAILLKWIEAGAPPEPRRKLKALRVEPENQTLPRPGETFPLRVTATFDDGTTEDVSQRAVYTPNDTSALRRRPNGDVQVMRRGRSSMMVRFLGEVSCVSVTVPLTDDPKFSGIKRPRVNFIDDHINHTLNELRLQHSPRGDDITYVRRVYLDLIGTLPTPEEVKTFVADGAADNRLKLAARLMNRPEFVDHWAYKWGDWLQIESQRLNRPGAAAFHRWIRQQLTQNTPLDRMAKELLLAQGDAFQVGQANFHRVPQNARMEAEQVSRLFMGVRLECANCHNHPLDRWTQDDYHGLSAMFARIVREQQVRFIDRGEAIHPRTGKPAMPRLPGVRFMGKSEKSLPAFSQWLTTGDNPFFARAMVNRIWRELMGRGLVEPIDDHRATNPATHPKLLAELAQDFVKQRFDMRQLLTRIVASAAYQRSSLSAGNNGSDDRFYAKALVKPLPPPVMIDAVAQVTGVAERLGNFPQGTRAISLGDARIPSLPLDLLGRCDRRTACAPAEAGRAALPLTLHTINGAWLNAKIQNKQGRLHKLFNEKTSVSDLIIEFYQQALCRPPTSNELRFWKQQLSNKQVAAFEDFLWALLNSAEFCSNH